MATRTSPARTTPAARGGKASADSSANGARRLVIVESPAKARTIAGYLGKGYVVESSIGHIRDMPGSAADIPDKLRKEPWARLGVNIDADFEPLYVVNADKRQQVSKLKQLLKDADELLLATDEDREGEAIAWHLVQELKPKVPARRMVFHEITPEAIAAAVAHPRDVDNGLVEAYQTRRVLDRLYGYEVSPVLWKKVMPQLSAGRVQSVAIRLVVEREKERIAFRPASYWDLEAEFAPQPAGQDATWFTATLVALDGQRIAQGRDFSPTGELRTAASADDRQAVQVLHLDAAAAAGLAGALRRRVRREVCRTQALPPVAVRTVPYHDASAGGLAQAGLLGEVHHAGGATPVRERSHHLYADRLGDAVRNRAHRGQEPGQGAVRRRVRRRLPAYLYQ